MTFIATLIALLMERYFHWQHLRQWSWFMRYERWLSFRLQNLPNSVRLWINVLPPVLIVGCISLLLSGILYGLFTLIFGILVLLYCLGPQNLWVEVCRYFHTINQKDSIMDIEAISTTFSFPIPETPQAFHYNFVSAIFIKANEKVFSVLFWFVVLGPMGAVLYRLIVIFNEHIELGLSTTALRVKQILEWLPIRVLTFLFALGGHFTQVFHIWKNHVSKNPAANESLLTECGIAALDVKELDQFPETGIAEKEALSLLDRAFVIFLVILAIGVIVI